MEIKINNVAHEVPFDLQIISLGDYLKYYEQYGRELDKQLEEIEKKDYKKVLAEKGFVQITEDDMQFFKGLDFDNHIDNEAIAWFSYWSGVDLFVMKEMPEIIPLLTQYRLFRYATDESLKVAEQLPLIVMWDAEEWEIQDYKVAPDSSMNFNEIITSKEVMRQIYALGKRKWDALPYLCAIFFRKKGEVFSDELILAGGERMNLMNELPLFHAMQVAFFLSICVSIWSSTLVYSQSQDPVENPSLN